MSCAAFSYGVEQGKISGGNIRQGVVYRSDVVRLVSEMAIGEADKNGQPRQAMRYRFELLGFGKEFYVYNSHYRAGDKGPDEEDRQIEAEAIRADSDELGAVPIIYAGDFNLYSAMEPAYEHLLAEGDGRACDPLSGDGGRRACSSLADWSSLDVHTHSTSVMDERFDIHLVSDELLDGRGMDLFVDSYRVFANNGSYRFGESITTGVGTTADVLNALALTSDHLPVVADYVPAPIGDSSLDDVFDSSDLVAVFQAGQYEDGIADNTDWQVRRWRILQSRSCLFAAVGYSDIGFIMNVHIASRRCKQQTLEQRFPNAEIIDVT